MVVAGMVDATGGEMTPFTAADLLRQCGMVHIQNALDTLRWYRKSGKPVLSPAGLLRSCATGLKAGTWTLNGCVTAMVEEERRAIQRAAELAEERKREMARLAEQKQQRARAQAAADLLAKQREAERMSRIPPTLRGAWEAALPQLQERLGRATFEAHIRPLLPVRDEAADGVGARSIQIETPGTGFTLNWLQRKAGDLQETLASCLGCAPDTLTITFVSPHKGSV
jgi:hypothetical protein